MRNLGARAAWRAMARMGQMPAKTAPAAPGMRLGIDLGAWVGPGDVLGAEPRPVRGARLSGQRDAAGFVYAYI